MMISKVVWAIAIVALLPVHVASSMTCDVINVRELGAVGDGEHDDTQAFLDAVKMGREEQKNIYVPIGKYLTSKTIVLDKIAMTGPQVSAWPGDEGVHMPSIIPTHRDGPAIQMLDSAALDGIDVSYASYPEDATGGPAAIMLSAPGVYLRNLRIRNAWDGISSDWIHNVGRLNIDNVFMASIQNIGVFVTSTLDVPRINNVEVWNHAITGRALNQGIGFKFVHNDMIRLTDCFVFSMRTGFLFEQKKYKSGTVEFHGMTWSVMNGCSVDACQYGVQVVGDHDLSISGGLFWTHWGGMMVYEGNAMIRVSGSELKANGGPALRVVDCGHIALTGNSLFHPLPGYNTPAVILEGGNTVMSGNYILSSDKGISVGPNVESVLIVGNTIQADKEHVKVDERTPDDSVLIQDNITRSYAKEDHEEKGSSDENAQ